MSTNAGFYHQSSLIPVPMLRLKKEERESPFVYKTPWHIGKRAPWYFGKRSPQPADQKRSTQKADQKRSPPLADQKRSPPLADLYTASWIGSLFKPSSEEKQQNMKHSNGRCSKKIFLIL